MNDRQEYAKLINACKGGRADSAAALLKAGLDPNYRVTDNEIKWTPLFLAARGCSVEVVHVLIKHGADVNARSSSDQTPLHAVFWNKHPLPGMNEVVHALLEAGALVNAKNQHGQTPLHWAAHYGHVDAVRLLVKYGADVRVRNDDGETPLDKALGGPRRATAARQIAQILQQGTEAPQLSVLSHLWGRLPSLKTMHTWNLSLISSMTSVHEAKLYYTLLRKLVATKVCSPADAQGWLEKALDRISNTLKTKALEHSFRLLVDKAVEDGMIAPQTIEVMHPHADRGDCDNSTITSDGPEEPCSFCRFVRAVAQPDNFRFEHLDGSTQALQNAMGLLFQKMMVLNLDDRELLFDTESRSSISLERKQRIEIQMQALVSMLRGVLNVILRGAESDLEKWYMDRICARIVDWGDLKHIQECISEETSDQSEAFSVSFANGVQLARDVAENVEDESTGKRLDNVFDRKDPFLVLGMICAMGQPDYGKIDDEHFENFQKAMKKTPPPAAIKKTGESPENENGSTDSPSRSSTGSDTGAESCSSNDVSSRQGSLSSNNSTGVPSSGGALVDALTESQGSEARDNVRQRSERDLRLSHSGTRMSPISETDVKVYASVGSTEQRPAQETKNQNGTRRSVSIGSSSSRSFASSVASHQSDSAHSNSSRSAYASASRSQDNSRSLPSGDRMNFPLKGPIRQNFNVSPENTRAILKITARQPTPSPPPAPPGLQTASGPLPAPPAIASQPKSQPRVAPMPRPHPVPSASSTVLREIYEDARLCQEDEDELVLHAAVKFGDIDLLKESLDEVSEEEINAIDSCGRTAMDLAALTGQIQLLKMLEEKGGKFVFKGHGSMLATSRLRSLNVTQYLKLVEEEL